MLQACSSFVDVIHYPGSDLFSAVLGSALYLDFGSADIGVERGFDSLADERAFLTISEIKEVRGNGFSYEQTPMPAPKETA